MTRKKIGLIALVVVGLAALGGLVYFGSDGGEVALAEMQVDNLTCGSCIKKVKKALGEVPGTEKVEVSLTTGRVKAEFIPEKSDPETLARALAEAGYPAVVKQVFSPQEYLNLRQDVRRLAATHVGRVGDRLISRDDFNLEISRMKRTAMPSPGMDEQALQRAAWQSIVQRQILLGEAERLNVLVRDEEVEAMIHRMRQGMKGFDAAAEERIGNKKDFSQLLKDELIIRRLIDEQVPGEKTEGSFLRQERLNKWYQELVDKTPVEVFDPALRSALESGTGSCCRS